MAKRFAAELPRKQMSAGSELSARILQKVFAPTRLPTNVTVAWNIIGETS
jgi:hypothetical protein